MGKRIIFSIAFLLFLALDLNAQKNSDYTWVPLKTLELRQFHYNTNIPIYAVALKKVEDPALLFPSSMFFSEKPNEVKEGYYAVNTSKLTISIDNKKNTIKFEQLQDIGDGWKGMKFKKPLYILKGDANVRLRNMEVCITKNDYAKLTGKTIGNQNSSNSSYNQKDNIANNPYSVKINISPSLFSPNKSYTNYNPNRVIKDAFTTPEKCDYTFLRTNTIDGIKCDHYLENVRTFRFPNGDFISYPEGDEGLEDMIPSMSFSSKKNASIGNWKLTKNNGIVCTYEADKELITFTYPNGAIVTYQYVENENKISTRWSEMVARDSKTDPYGPKLSLYLDNNHFKQLYLPNKKEPLKYIKMDRGPISGYYDGYRLYNFTPEGQLAPIHIIFNNQVAPANAQDSIISMTNTEIKYANGDYLRMAQTLTGVNYIVSGTIHRNGGVLTIKEANGKIVKLLTLANGDKYTGDFNPYNYMDDINRFWGTAYGDDLYPGLSYPELTMWNGTYIKANGQTIKYKDGKTEKMIAAERQAQNAKAKAQYNQLCKQFGQRYVDAALAQTPIVGMPEKLLQVAFNLRLIESGTKYKMYRINGLGWKDFGRTLSNNALLYTVWVSNGRVTDVRYWGN